MTTQTIKLGDVCDVRDGTHDTPKPKETGFPLVTSKFIKDGRIDISQAYFISKDDYDAINKRSKVDKWDILITMIGTVGDLALIDFEPVFAIKNVGLIKTNDELLAKYLYYYLGSVPARTYIAGQMNGSSQQFLSLTSLRNFPIPLPPLAEQRRVAGILGSLDEKIENNRRLIRTTEALARILFKKHIVNNEESEGWENGKISDICSRIQSGGTPNTKRNDYYDGTINWFKTKELLDGFVFDSEMKITEEGLNNSSAKLFPKDTVMMAIYAAPTVGRLGILTKESSFNQATVGLVGKDNFSPYFIYLLLYHLRDDFNNLANGAAQQNISVGLVKDYEIKLPPAAVLQTFNAAVEPLFAEIGFLTRENQTLAATRDKLLRKLIK